MTIFVEVVTGGQQMTMSVDRIISINDVPYEENSHPTESSLAARVTIMERTMQAVIHDLGQIIGMVVTPEDPPTPEQAVERINEG